MFGLLRNSGLPCETGPARCGYLIAALTLSLPATCHGALAPSGKNGIFFSIVWNKLRTGTEEAPASGSGPAKGVGRRGRGSRRDEENATQHRLRGEKSGRNRASSFPRWFMFAADLPPLLPLGEGFPQILGAVCLRKP